MPPPPFGNEPVRLNISTSPNTRKRTYFLVFPNREIRHLVLTWSEEAQARQAHNLKVVSSNLAPATK